MQYVLSRAVARSENQGARSTVVCIICPLVEIGLTDLPKIGSGGGALPPRPPAPTALCLT